MMTYIPRSLQDYILQVCINPIYKQTHLRPAPCLAECDETEQRAFSEYAATQFRTAGLLNGTILSLQLDGSLATLALAEEQILDAICSGWSNECEQMVTVSLTTDAECFSESAWRETVTFISGLSRQTVVFVYANPDGTDPNGMLRDLENELSRLKVFRIAKNLSGSQVGDYVCSYIRKQGFEIMDEAAFRKSFFQTFSGVTTFKQAQQVADILMDCAVETEAGWAVGAESVSRAIGG